MKKFLSFAAIASLGIAYALATPFNPTENSSFETADPNNPNLAYQWAPQWNGYKRVAYSDSWDGSYVLMLSNASTPSDLSGAVQRITFNQQTATPVRISLNIKGVNIQNLASDKYGATLYCRVHYQNGATDYCPTTAKTKNVGTFPWRLIGWNTGEFPNGNQPIQWIEVVPIMGKITGTAYFDDVHVSEYDTGFNGAVTFMADDGDAEQYTVFYPQLKQAGYPCVISAVVNYLGTPGYITESQLHTMQNNGCEVVSHSMNHLDMTTLTASQMDHEFYDSKVWFNQHGFIVHHFALPFGAYNAQVIGEAQNCYINHQLCYDSVRLTDRGENSSGVFPYRVLIEEVDAQITMADVDQWLEEAIANKKWLVIVFHEIRSDCGTETYCTTPSMLSNVIGDVKARGIPAVTYSRGFQLATTVP